MLRTDPWHAQNTIVDFTQLFSQVSTWQQEELMASAGKLSFSGPTFPSSSISTPTLSCSCSAGNGVNQIGEPIWD